MTGTKNHMRLYCAILFELRLVLRISPAIVKMVHLKFNIFQRNKKSMHTCYIHASLKIAAKKALSPAPSVNS